MSIIGPYGYVALAIAWVASVAIGFFKGADYGEDKEYAKRQREDQVIAVASAAAAASAAEAISKIEVKHVTIRQRTETVMRDNPVYRDCVHDSRVLNDINAARGYESPASGGVVPPASAASR